MDDQQQQLGKYTIVQEIGRGAFATVYRALDTTLDRDVALKILHPQLLADTGFTERFQREARALARLAHPHIVTIYEIGSANGRLFIAMELVAGPSLGEAIARRGNLQWDETVTILDSIAGALDYAHSERILHRDLKPANILLHPRRGPLLTDFGFAKLVGESSMSISVSGGVVGTPAYIAPEVWDGEEVTRQTDVYALACIAYEMLTGQVLFSGETPSEMMRKHLIDGPLFVISKDKQLPIPVIRVLREALARDPGQRYGSAGEFAKALVGSADGEDISRPGTRQDMPWMGPIVAALAATVVFAAALGWILWGPGLPSAQDAPTASPTPAALAQSTSPATQTPTQKPPLSPTAEPENQHEQEFLTPDTPTTLPPQTEAQAVAKQLVESFQKARHTAYATWDTEPYYHVLAKDALESSLSVVRQLRERDCRYYFSDETDMRFTLEEATETHVVLIAHRYEVQRRVCPATTEYVCQDYDGRYVIERIGDRWFITHSSVQNYTQVTPCP